MKKIKIFNGIVGMSLLKLPSLEDMENKVNAFLLEDGKLIKVIDVRYQSNGNVFSVLVYYDDLEKKTEQKI